MKFLGEDLKIDAASEPTDIIWENRQYEDFDRSVKSFFVWIIIFIMLAISAGLIYKCTLISNSAKFMFPLANCPATAIDWHNMQMKSEVPDIWEKASVVEYAT